MSQSERCDCNSVSVIFESGKGSKRRSKLCHRFVKRVGEVSFVTSMSVALVFKSRFLIFGGNW